MISLEVQNGLAAGRRIDSRAETIRIGRSPLSELALSDELVSGEHLRITALGDRYVARDDRSTNGTAILRGGERIPLDDMRGREAVLDTGDVLELGGERGVRVRVVVAEEPDTAHVFAVRPIDETTFASKVEGDDSRLRSLYQAQKRIGAETDLSDVLNAIADAAFDLVPRATHVTVVLRDEEDERALAGGAPVYVPIITRVRGQIGPSPTPIPITRSVVRKVVSDKAAVLAADAPREVGESESLMGAQIRSVMGIPLWKGGEILGVLQMDNRESAGVFLAADLEVMAVLAHHASLAVANARLLRRLRTAEDKLRKENAYLRSREETRRVGKGGQHEIIGKAPVMQTLLEQLGKVVDTRVSVLIEGETGVGKELIAAAVHYRSKRREKLFVTQNCAAVPENLLESELFGHKKGAFTGAHEEKKGLFEIADGGTLFLDEVTEMALSLQSKLLRALQEGEIRPVGATQERKVNVRIVAACNRSLEQEVAAGRFREDLYYRLKVFPLRVPPLRERREDVPLLAEHFLRRYSEEMGKASGGFSQQAMELLQAYDWPGNVRELQNEVQRLVIQIDPGGFATPELLSPRIRQIEGVVERAKPTRGTLKETMDQLERYILIEALRDSENNKTLAAKRLGITREGLHKKLRGFGL